MNSFVFLMFLVFGLICGSVSNQNNYNNNISKSELLLKNENTTESSPISMNSENNIEEGK